MRHKASNVIYSLALTGRTIRHLRPAQIINRILRRVKPVPDIRPPSFALKMSHGTIAPFVERLLSILGNANFIFLNHSRQLVWPHGWGDSAAPKLWLYNLHYFEGLLCPETPDTLKEELIARWLLDNPPGRGVGWEPYPLSLRIVNWIKWSLIGGKLSDDAVRSLAVQARFLHATLEYHLLGNHLFANAKALVFAGCFFAGEEAERWLCKGLNILGTQIKEQFLLDGGHFELSTTYHALLTEDLLDLINIMRAGSMPVPREWLEAAGRALSWLRTMTRPDGLPPLFNDAAYGITPTCKELSNYAERLGISRPAALSPGMNDLPHSGYFRYEGEKFSFFGDIGPIGPDYIPGHGHCDMLNFEFYANGQPVIVDTGTSTYEIGETRLSERGTAAHNTVQVDDREQSEIWASFRIARRAKIIERKISDNEAVGAIKSYGRDAYTHHRRFNLSDQNVSIQDDISGIHADSICRARFHFHPVANPELRDGKIVYQDIEIISYGADRVEIMDYFYAPEFNKRIPAKVAVITFRKSLRTEIIV